MKAMIEPKRPLDAPVPRRSAQTPPSLWKFITIGSLFATVEEFLVLVLIKGEFAGYLFTLFIVFPVFLGLVFFASQWLDRFSRSEPWRELLHFFTFGTAGLMIEWFLIGLSPWSNPDANPLLMTLFQLGMFSFWATVAFIPRLILNQDAISRRISRKLCLLYFLSFAAIYALALLLPFEMRFGPIISLVISLYLALNFGYARYFYLRLSAISPPRI